MRHLHVFPIRLCVCLALFSACLAAVTPHEDVTFKKITKYAKLFSRSHTHLRKTPVTAHNLPSKALLKYLSSSRLESPDNHRKMGQNTLETIIGRTLARATTLQATSRQSGLNFDPCSDDSNCASGRVCGTLGDDAFIRCSGSGFCFCLPPDLNDLPCTSDASCDDGESCITVESETQFCASDNGLFSEDSDSDSTDSNEEDGNEESTQESEPVCIGSEFLTHLSREELAFEQDSLAHVLCDMNESCATPGHMVVYKGQALMMKNYCKVVGCARRVKHVNSPKYVRKLVIPSKTEDLVFTAFAARFETTAEEGVLSTAVRLGF